MREPAARPSASSKDRPNYLLLLVGIALLAFAVFARKVLTMPAVAEAAVLGLGFAITLYGVYPFTVMRGTFSGFFGRVAVTGPAAVGILVFFVALKALTDDAQRRDQLVDAQREAERLLTFIARDPTYGTRRVQNSSVQLLDVDSFQPKRILPVVTRLRESLDRAGVPEGQRDAEVQRLLAGVMTKLRLPAPYSQGALASVRLALAGDASADATWENAVKGGAELASSPEKFMDRVKRLPFAVISVTGRDRAMFIVSEGSRFAVDGVAYDVPVIANPDLDVVRMPEAVALKRVEQQ